MANNEILPFAGTDTGTNLLTQAEYNADSQRSIGNQPGVARSKLANKVLRQTSLIAAAVAQFLANRQANDITDSLTPATLAGYFLNVIGGDIQKSSFNASAAGGTVDAITGTFTPAITVLSNGLSVFIRASGANTATTPTFTPNSGTVTAKAIVKGNNLALVAGDIAGAGHWLELQYDSTLDKWVLQNPAYGVMNGLTQAQADARYIRIGYMLVKDEKAQGTHGGASVVGIQTRTLNTVSANTISGASLASNQITLPTGTYRIRVRAPAFVNSTKGFFYNVTDAANAIIGYNYNGIAGPATDQAQSDAFIDGRITIASAKVFEVRQYCSEATASDGLGASVGQGTEVYTTVEIIKES